MDRTNRRPQGRLIAEAGAAQGSAAMTNQRGSGMGGRRGGDGGGRCRGAVLRRGLEEVRWISARRALSTAPTTICARDRSQRRE
jgi:hypothetical protein